MDLQYTVYDTAFGTAVITNLSCAPTTAFIKVWQKPLYEVFSFGNKVEGDLFSDLLGQEEVISLGYIGNVHHLLQPFPNMHQGNDVYLF